MDITRGPEALKGKGTPEEYQVRKRNIIETQEKEKEQENNRKSAGKITRRKRNSTRPSDKGK